MDWQIGNVLIGLTAIAFTVVVIVMRASGRPLMPRFVRWVTAHPQLANTMLSLLMIVWGAVIWYLLISQSNYSNTLAMIMAGLLICTGIVFLIAGILKKNH